MSQIVTTVILVVLVLVAIGIVWGVISSLIGDSADDISLGKFTINLEAENARVSGEDILVDIKRLPGGGDLTKIKFIISNGTNTEIIEQEVTLEELEQETYTLEGITMPLEGVVSISVAPVYSAGSGEDTLADISDTINIGEGGLSEDEGEGGDPEDCGNDQIDAGEICDGIALTPYTTDCSTYLDFTGGDLSCLGTCLDYNTDLCTGAECIEPSSQDCSLTEGVCAGIQQNCTGSEWPGCSEANYTTYNSSYEVTEINCTDGYDNDCNGLADNEEVTCEFTWAGTVIDPWPSETKILFIVNETTEEFVAPEYIYTGMYVGFTGGSEIRCLQIHDYVTPDQSELFDQAIVRIDDAPSGGLPIDITTGNTFTIYQKSECGA